MESLPMEKIIARHVHKQLKKGFSLIEVLIFVSIASVFFVSVAAVTTVSLRDMKINEHKILATRYAEELLSWLKSEKEENWSIFFARSIPQPGRPYCFNTEANNDIEWPPFGDCDDDDYNFGNPSIYMRQATLSSIGASQVKINIVVRWNDLNNAYSVPINTLLSQWE